MSNTIFGEDDDFDNLQEYKPEIIINSSTDEYPRLLRKTKSSFFAAERRRKNFFFASWDWRKLVAR